MTVVAIDGPAGAGKSTLARGVANALGWRYLDTGAMYRALALAALVRGVDLADADAVASVAHTVEIDVRDGTVLLDGADVSSKVRDTEVSSAASRIAAYPGVRAALVAKQRALADRVDLVIEGRDIGTVVAPDAAVKVFLTADLDERARRRARQLGLPDDRATTERMAEALEQRDEADASRDASPLARSRDAVLIDSTHKDPDAIVAEVVALLGGAASAS